MCGFVGLVTNKKISSEQLIKLDLAAESIKFRGPDYVGRWTNAQNNIAIIHNRLSILDISKNGNQPMQSNNKRFTLAYNGELYNYLEIKKKINQEFPDIKWNGTSDTEVFLKSIELYGLEDALKIFNGMFSFSLWDNKKNLLFLGRDLIGEKPLYYYHKNNNFYFSSQIKCFKSFGINLEIDSEALKLYLNLNYIPSPYCIFKNIKKLNPGNILKYDFNNDVIEIKRFEKIKFDYKEKNENNIISLKKILEEVIEQQLIADVPVGVFLSGGLDSSLVASIASKVSKNKIRTFCISQKNKNYNESTDASLVGKELNTEHYNILIDKNNILEATESISNIYDEPFSDSSQIPTTILCKEVSKHGKVFLTGDGGDEMFGGYNRYIYINLFNNLIKKIHPYFRKKLKKILKFLCNLDSILINKLFFKFYQNFNDKLLKISNVIDLDESIIIYKNLIINFYSEKYLKENINVKEIFLDKSIFQNSNINDSEKFMLQDINMYLPDDIFVKTDRASMFFSIETRSPLVDRRVVRFAEKLPHSAKIQGLNGKTLIRELLKKYLPSSIINKKKMGFGLPLDDLIRNDLRDFSIDSIKDLEKMDLPFINFGEINYMMKLHFEKRKNYSYELWNLIMLSAWYRKFYSD